MRILRWRVRTLAGLVVVAALGIKGVLYLRSDDDALLRREALARLIDPPRPASVESTLVAALSDPDPGMRRTATWALDQIGSNSPALVPVLIGELEDLTARSRQEDHWRQEQVHPAQALKRMKLPAAVIAPLLRKAMASEDRWVRLQATVVLCDAAGRPGPPDPTLAALLLAALQDDDAVVRGLAPEALVRLDGKTRRRAVALLLEQLRGPDRESQFLATIGLARFGEEGREAVAILADRLQSRDLATRFADLYLLGRLGPVARPAVPEIVRAMTSPDAGKPLFQPLKCFLTNGSHSSDARLNLDWGKMPSSLCPLGAAVLEKIGPEADRQAVGILFGMLRLEDESRRLSAVDALGALGPRASAAIPTLLEWAERETSGWPEKGAPAIYRLLEALRQICAGDDPRLVATLLRLLKSANSTQRYGAAMIFKHLGPPAPLAVPALIEALRDGAQAVRHSAAQALGRYEGPGREAAELALLDALEDEDDYVRLQAAKSLARHRAGAGRVVPTLVPLLRGKRPNVRRIASEILGEFGPAAGLAVPALLEARHDPEEHVRDAAEKALKAIAPPGAAAPVE